MQKLTCILALLLLCFIAYTQTISGAASFTPKENTAHAGTRFLLAQLASFQAPFLPQAPVAADFSFNNNACSGTDVQFTPSVTSGTAPFSYTWDFGDAANSAAQTPVHAYTALGCATTTFAVTLKVKDALGDSVVVKKNVTVKQAPNLNMQDLNSPFSPFSNCSHSPTNANPSFIIRLGIGAPTDVCITTFTVDWGDGGAVVNGLTAASFPLPPHTYTSLGIFNLVVTALGSNGCSTSKTYPVVNQANPAVGISGPGSTSGCAPSGFWFKVSRYELNSPGTVYVWDFGDKSPTVTWTTPITVDSIFHVFTTTSCGQAGNQFTVKVTAKNGCDSTASTVNNIKIFQKPVASFTMPASACVSTPVQFTSTGAGAYNQGDCNRTTTYGWSSDDGGTATTANFTHSFTTTGMHTVTLIAGGSCGNDTVSKTICISSVPTSSFTIDNASGCPALAVNTTNTSTASGGCIPVKYKWSVAYTATSCGTTISWQFVNGNDSSVNPSFSFVNPGTYTITLDVTNGCSKVTSSKAVVVKKPPTVLLANIPVTGCAPAAINPSATVTNCGTAALTYLWTLPGGALPAPTALIPGQVVLNAGVYNISLAATNECGTTTATQALTVKDLPAAPTAGSNSPVCSGSTLNLTASAVAGALYAWTGPGGYTNTTQNPARTNATTAMSGMYSVTVNVNGCVSAPGTVNAVISQTAANPTVVTPVNYCQNAAATPLTATAVAGNTLNWYTTATGGTPGTTAPTPVTTTVGTATFYVSQVNPAAPACESGRVAITVNIASIPVISGTFVNPSTCSSSNGTITVTGLTGTTTGVQYAKNNGTPINIPISGNTSGNIVILALSSGSYTVTATANGCVSKAIGPFVLVNPSAPTAPTASSNSPLCSGSNLNLTASTVAGAAYAWTGPGGFISTVQNPVRADATAAMSGTYSVTASLNGCASAPASVDVVIGQAAGAPAVTTPVNYCQNAAAAALTATAAAGNTLNWYTAATGGTPATTAPVPVTTAVGTTTYYVSQSAAAACESPRAAIAVNVLPAPAISGSSSDPASCLAVPGVITITGLAPSATYSVAYTKNGGTPVVFTITSNASGWIPILNLLPGTYTNITASINGCTSNAIGPFTIAGSGAPAAPTAGSNSPLCAGSTLNLTASAVAGATYAWTGPGGFTSTAQNPARADATTAMSGTYSVTASLNGCVSAAATVNVAINSAGAATAASNTPVCAGSTLTLTSSATAASSYTWSGPNNFSSSLQNPSIQNVTQAASGTYTVTATSTQGTCSTTATASVTIAAKPVITATYTNPASCSASGGAIILNGLMPGTPYSVQYAKDGGPPVSSTLTSDASGSISIGNLLGGTYSNISAMLGGCTSNTAGPFTLTETNTAPARPKATGNSPLCAGNTLLLGASTASTGIIYQWTGPNGFTSRLQNPSISNVTAAAGGRYYVLVSAGSCISEKDSVDITISDYPVVNLGPDLVLAPGVQHTLTATLQSAPGLQYLWTPATNLSCSTCASPVVTVQSNISYTLKVTNSYGCSASDTISIKTLCENANVFIPDAFTPDGDGLNDKFLVRASGPIRVKYLRVFNKWGEMVFEKLNFLPNDPAYGWDGRVKGTTSPPDVFVYIAQVACDNGTVFTYKGNVSVLR